MLGKGGKGCGGGRGPRRLRGGAAGRAARGLLPCSAVTRPGARGRRRAGPGTCPRATPRPRDLPGRGTGCPGPRAGADGRRRRDVERVGSRLRSRLGLRGLGAGARGQPAVEVGGRPGAGGDPPGVTAPAPSASAAQVRGSRAGRGGRGVSPGAHLEEGTCEPEEPLRAVQAGEGAHCRGPCKAAELPSGAPGSGLAPRRGAGLGRSPKEGTALGPSVAAPVPMTVSLAPRGHPSTRPTW